jgi:hypothetical protein
VVITTRGRLVFVAESFEVDMARRLASLVLDAQGTGEMQQAVVRRPAELPVNLGPETLQPLTGDLVRFFSNCGVMKAAVEAGVRGIAQGK